MRRHRHIKVLGYSENNNTVAFELIVYLGKKEKQYLGFGIHNFVSDVTQVAPNTIIPNYKEEIIETLSTNDFHFNVRFVHNSIPRNRLKNKYRLCKF